MKNNNKNYNKKSHNIECMNTNSSLLSVLIGKLR